MKVTLVSLTLTVTWVCCAGGKVTVVVAGVVVVVAGIVVVRTESMLFSWYTFHKFQMSIKLKDFWIISSARNDGKFAYNYLQFTLFKYQNSLM